MSKLLHGMEDQTTGHCYKPRLSRRRARMEFCEPEGQYRAMASWFDQARFGLFIHWGHSSQRGCELSWPMVGGVFALPDQRNVSVNEYHSTAATFNPTNYDPGKWARLAKRAGAQYAVLTAKHHDGYSMFHTRQSNFSIEHSPYGKDIVGQFTEAFRSEGLRVGLYYSLIDWHHPDYPAFADADKPYQWGQWRQPTEGQWVRFIDFMFEQIRELLTNYGKIDLVWFDGGWERTAEQWRSARLHKMMKQIQPELLINDRLPGCGDYDTPEQFIPPRPPSRAWETCMTMNDSWGYNPTDTHYKSARRLIHTICEVAGQGGNLLLNISPTGDGTIPAEQAERLEAIGKWFVHNQESIIGTLPGLQAHQFYGPSTRRGDRLYLHLLSKPYESVSVREVRINRAKRAWRLGGGELRLSKRCAIVDLMRNPDPSGELTVWIDEAQADPAATVVALDFDPKK
ncbi:MAG TPA: alpha-L-fucosidase [Candidatus Binataceae bacterium]